MSQRKAKSPAGSASDGEDIEEQILEVLEEDDRDRTIGSSSNSRRGTRASYDASGRKYIEQRNKCCGYPSTKECFAGTFISLKFWASFAGVLFVVITLLVIDAKVNESIYMTKALAFWNMNETAKLEDLTRTCVCIQYMCQGGGNSTTSSNPMEPGRVATHALR